MLFQEDAAEMASHGYFPTSQSWAPGSYGCGAFLLALILFVFVIGILIFIYLLMVKPEGTLSVTYELREDAAPAKDANPYRDKTEKTCPQCAEQVKSAAKVCRFCGHSFA